MFGYRTPVNKSDASVNIDQSKPTEKTGSSQVEITTTETSKVRRSIGEWEAGNLETESVTLHQKTLPVEGQKQKPKKALSQGSAEKITMETSASPPKEKKKYANRLAEARACVTKAKINLGNSRNISNCIKNEVLLVIDRLYEIIKETETGKKQGEKQEGQAKETTKQKIKEVEIEDRELIKKIEYQSKLIEENNTRIEGLKSLMEKQNRMLDRHTYASVTADRPGRQLISQTALHSVIVTAKDETETGEEILNQIRHAVNAKEGGVTVEKVRKAKDRKVILGCRTEDERRQLKEKLSEANNQLVVKEIKNKNPLIIFKNVLSYNKDEEIIKSIKNQNKILFKGINEEETKMEILFKRKTNNPHTHHIIMRVSPKIWRSLIAEGSVRIDLQRIQVEDQSPLVQCSLCLSYGHTKRFCKDKEEKCSHCGGPHKKLDCPEWSAGTTPVCCNCVRAKMDRTDHNAFSQDCPIRRKWDYLARTAIAYC